MSIAEITDSQPTGDVYRALVRSLRRRKGFGLVFVQATVAETDKLLPQLREDLPRKKIGVLTLEEPIDKLLPLIADQPKVDQLNILVIRGLEKSIEVDIKQGFGGEGDYYNLNTVPPILIHLNQQRERFKDQYGHLCFLFVLPFYAIKYFIRRAPDFFDWSTGVFTLEDEQAQTTKAVSDILQTANYAKYLSWSTSERNREILRIQALLEELPEKDNQKARLFYELSALFYVSGNFGAAIDCCDQSLKLQFEQSDVWYSRGLALAYLGREEESIESWDRAIVFRPNFYWAWYNRGLALDNIGQKAKAIESYDKAIQFKPNFHEAWYNRGHSLDDLGRKAEAIESYDKAIQFKPDKYWAWNDRGLVLSYLGRKAEAIESYDKAIQFKPDLYAAWYNRGLALFDLSRKDEAIESYDKAIQLKPDYYEAWFRRGLTLSYLGRKAEAIESYDKAIQLKPDYYEAWNNLGATLYALDRKEEAIESYDKAIQFKPDYYEAWGNRGLALSELDCKKEAITSHNKAIQFKPDSDGVWYNLGNTLYDLDRKEEAIASYDRAIELNPEYATAYYKRGNVLKSLGRFDDAIQSLMKAQAIQKNIELEDIPIKILKPFIFALWRCQRLFQNLKGQKKQPTRQ
ncbi:MAG: tetratricopeptide repeat protein [Cyanobacteria bacterium P01_D01_bin.44]